MVRSTDKSTYFKELQFPFFKFFYTLIVHYVINFVFSIGKQPYRDVINFALYIIICSIVQGRQTGGGGSQPPLNFGWGVEHLSTPPDFGKTFFRGG